LLARPLAGPVSDLDVEEAGPGIRVPRRWPAVRPWRTSAGCNLRQTSSRTRGNEIAAAGRDALTRQFGEEVGV
jgi:hypothetical protein